MLLLLWGIVSSCFLVGGARGCWDTPTVFTLSWKILFWWIVGRLLERSNCHPTQCYVCVVVLSSLACLCLFPHICVCNCASSCVVYDRCFAVCSRMAVVRIHDVVEMLCPRLFQTLPVVTFYSRSYRISIHWAECFTAGCVNWWNGPFAKKWLVLFVRQKCSVMYRQLFVLDACRSPSSLHLGASSNTTTSITTALGQTVELFPPTADSICRSLPNVTTRRAWNKTTQIGLLLTDVLDGSRFMFLSMNVLPKALWPCCNYRKTTFLWL